jgi:dihydroorotate dehydrogenase
LAALAKRLPDAPLIAAGGIHTSDQVNAALATGARAVQLDSVVWVEPGAVGRILAKVGKNQEF